MNKYTIQWNQEKDCHDIYKNGKFFGDAECLKDAEQRIEWLKETDEDDFRQEIDFENSFRFQSEEARWDSVNWQD